MLPKFLVLPSGSIGASEAQSPVAPSSAWGLRSLPWLLPSPKLGAGASGLLTALVLPRVITLQSHNFRPRMIQAMALDFFIPHLIFVANRASIAPSITGMKPLQQLVPRNILTVATRGPIVDVG